MRPPFTFFVIIVSLGLASCDERDVVVGPGAVIQPASVGEQEAISFLKERGHHLYVEDTGTRMSFAPQTESQEVTLEDIEAVNALKHVVEIRVIAFYGITPDVFARLRDFPSVNQVAIHYQMPAETFKYFDKFPNVETLTLWADHYISCEHLPPLQKLRVLHHESTEGDFTLESVQRIAACRSLEEIDILRPISEEGIAILRALPNLRSLIVDERTIVGTRRSSTAGDSNSEDDEKPKE